MAIKFRCACGKVLQVNDDQAGARCKCACGKILQVPKPAPAPAPAPAPPPSRAPIAMPAPAPRPAPPPPAPTPSPAHGTPLPAALEAVPPLTRGAGDTIASVVATPPPTPPPTRPLPAPPQAPLDVIPVSVEEDTAPFPPPPPAPAPMRTTTPPPVPPPPAPPAWTPPVGPPLLAETPLPYVQAAPTFNRGPAPLPDDLPWYDIDPRRRRRQRRRKRALILGAVCLLLACAGVALWLILRSSGPSTTGVEPPAASPLAMVPADAPFFATVRVADLWNSKALEKTRLGDGRKADDFLRDKLGLRLGDIDRVTLVFLELPDPARAAAPSGWLVIHSRVAISKETLRRAIFFGHDGVERKAKDKVYYSERDDAVHFPSDKEVWIGPTSVIDDLLNDRRNIAKEGPMKETIALAVATKPHLVVAMHMPELFKEEMRKAMPKEEAAALFVRPFFDMTGATILFNVDEGGDLACRLKFSKADSASDAKPVVDAGVRMGAENIRKLPAAPAMARLQDLLEKALRDMRVERKETEVVITAPNAGPTIGQLIEAVVPLIPVGVPPGPIPAPPPVPAPAPAEAK